MMLKLSSVQLVKILGKKATTYISGHKNDRELLFRLRSSNQMKTICNLNIIKGGSGERVS